MGMAALLTCFALAVVPPTGGGALLACPEVWQLCRALVVHKKLFGPKPK